jgi:hypothetical protein
MDIVLELGYFEAFMIYGSITFPANCPEISVAIAITVGEGVVE